MINKGLFSSNKDDWTTPKHILLLLKNLGYNFSLDPCASDTNHVCRKYYTKDQDGLIQDWSGEIVFCNPPYGRDIGKWVKKCYEENIKNKVVSVMLIPSRTDTRWFHDYILNKADIIFLKGRLKFTNSINSAPFPSMLVIYNK